MNVNAGVGEREILGDFAKVGSQYRTGAISKIILDSDARQYRHSI